MQLNDCLLMQRTERPRDTERGDGSTSATAERTSSLRLPWLQHALRALRPNRETDPERSPDWRSITRAPVQASPRPFLTKARARQTSAALQDFDPITPLRKHDRLFVAQVRTVQGAARWHCVRYVMAITKKRFSLPNCTKITAHS